jgi:hypothetical protein
LGQPLRGLPQDEEGGQPITVEVLDVQHPEIPGVGNEHNGRSEARAEVLDQQQPVTQGVRCGHVQVSVEVDVRL